MEIPYQELLALELWGNTVQDYAIFAGITLGVYLIFSIVITFTMKRLAKLAKKTKTNLDDVIITALRKLKWPIFVIIVLITVPTLLTVHEYVSTFSRYAIIILLTYAAIRTISRFLDYFTNESIKKEGHSNFLKPFSTILKVALWGIGGILILSNLGYDVTSLIAGLGIGGIAIALALQNVLSDIFSSLSIYFDKPFKPGDYIRLDDKEGLVKSVGIKTTRITSVQGEELVVPNNTLVSSNIQNFGKVKKRRIQFAIGICYETPLTKVKKAKKIIVETIKKQKNIEFDRTFFKTLGESALEFDIVFFVKSSEYKEYLKLQEKINFEIMQKFEKEGIHFAYPTQTVHVKR